MTDSVGNSGSSEQSSYDRRKASRILRNNLRDLAKNARDLHDQIGVEDVSEDVHAAIDEAGEAMDRALSAFEEGRE